MKKKGILLIISGPSGSGKGTVVGELLRLETSVFLSVSATTRSPRAGETEGEHYYFLSKPEFEEKISGGGMLEYTEYCGNYYGTPRERVEEMLGEGRDIILEIECDGAFQVKKMLPEAVLLFVVAPSLEELEQRLRGRGTESEEVVAQRLEQAKAEYAVKDEYDYIIVNHTPKQAAEDIIEIIKREKK